MEKEKIKKSKRSKVFETIFFGVSLVIALGLSLFLFKFLPLWITESASQRWWVINEHYILFNLIDGVVKTAIFVLYIAVISNIPSFKNIFEYHGAEHKSIHTYEKSLKLDPENAQKQSRFHPRCGTSFIIQVILISIVVYTFLPKQPDFIMNFLVRLAFLPVIAGISYEALKKSARVLKDQKLKRRHNILAKIINALIKPGLWLQRLTTKKPSKKQLEVALSALKKALELEKQPFVK